MNIATAVPQALGPLIGAAAVVVTGSFVLGVRARRRVGVRRRLRRRTRQERALMELDLRMRGIPAADAPTWTSPDQYWPALTEATRHLDAPVGALHLGALRHNALDMLRRANGMPIRVASKSRARARGRRGAACACPDIAGCSPTRWPRRCGSPTPSTTSSSAIPRPSGRASAGSRPMPSSRAASPSWSTRRPSSTSSTACWHPAAASRIRVCIELDASWDAPLLGHLGVRRSPVHDPADAGALAAYDRRATRLRARRHDVVRGADRRGRATAPRAARSTVR